MMRGVSRTRRLAAIVRQRRAPCATDGQHHALVATEPRISDESVEVDWTCAECGRVAKTVSFTRAAWETRRR